MIFSSIADKWVSRRARIDPAAIARVEGLDGAVVVTGGSSGIGLAIGERFAKAGQTVALVGRGEAALNAAVENLAKSVGADARILAIALDVTAHDAPSRLDGLLAEHRCYLDVLVNNAGVGLSGPFCDHEPQEIDRLVDLNVAAVTRLTRHVLPGMLARGRGGIINVASLGGLMPGPYQAAYYASKAYVVSLTRAIASETGGRGVRIASVLPGPVETSFHADMGANTARYRYLLPSMEPKGVAASVYRGYRFGHRLIVPGVFNWLTSRIAPLLPYNLLVPLMGWLLWPGEKVKR
ncbi:MAG: SDR family NAD(P)-dependent oxidoreductase [Alphaproteobacteria bacterium]|nr:SDR family NAD(P)-dependent oxidoreductase [Alphaproteobacteria bacterium]